MPRLERPAIVTTSVGRLAHLRRSLPLLLQHTAAPIYVVSAECPDGSAAWASRQSPRVTAVELDAPRAPDGALRFHKARCQNAGARAALARGATRLAFLDADTLVSEGFGAVALRPGPDVRISGAKDHGLTGLIVVPAQAFGVTGGYDESFVEYGTEDLDFRLRLYAKGYRFVRLPPRLTRVLSHDDALRLRHHDLSIDDANRTQFQKLLHNALGAGISKHQFLTDPEIQKLLGFSLYRRP